MLRILIVALLLFLIFGTLGFAVSPLFFILLVLLLAFTWATNYGWSSPRVETLLAFSVVMLAAFLYFETRAVEPLIPLSPRRRP